MSEQDLLKLLDLDGDDLSVQAQTTASGAGKIRVHTEGVNQAPVTPPSEYALDLETPLFSRRRGNELLSSSPKLQSMNLSSGKEQAVTDMLSAAYEQDVNLSESCVDKTRHDFMRNLLETPEYHALHEHTMFNPVNSEIAAIEFAEKLEGLIKIREQKQKSKPKLRKGQKPRTPEEQAMDDEVDAISQASQAVQAASEEVQAQEDAASACGFGDTSTGSGKADYKRIGSLYKRVKTSQDLRDIFNKAGRYRLLAQAKQRQKVTHGYDDMVGVTLGSDVGRLIASEMAALADEDMENELLFRLLNNQARLRETRGVESKAKGPVLVWLDESGSMSGERIHAAKALALAMAWIARQQRRWCGLLGFSNSTQRRLLTIPPGTFDESAVCTWLEGFFGSGTEPPFQDCEDWWQQAGAQDGKTDILLVTDGDVYCPKAQEQHFLHWKQRRQVRMISIIIDGTSEVLKSVSDEIHHVSNLDVTSEAVAAAVSI